MAKGTNTVRVIASCMIFNCARLYWVAPMRLAGTCSRYSNRAMPQLIRAAMYQARLFRLFRCPYQAKVMKMFDSTSRPAVWKKTGICMLVEAFDGLVGNGGEKVGGAAAARDHGLRRDFQQRRQHEGALVHARMRHR